tara:strand:+ start:547 stop:1176 length:630 start_codon:yes stop_codon:yes gene_type:complete
MPLNIVNLFKTDQEGYAIPEIFPGSEWAMNSAVLMTIKLDAVAVEIGWDQVGVCWTIMRLHSNGSPDEKLYRNLGEAGKEVWEAFDGPTVKQTGKFLVYGKGINGNPHRLDKTLFAKFMPITHELVVQEHKTIVKRGAAVTVEEFFNSIWRELLESPEIEGLVFHREDATLKVLGMAKVTRGQMKLLWPIPVLPIQQQLSRAPVTSMVM